MYNNPIGPGAAGAGLAGFALWFDQPVLWVLFAALAAFTLLNAAGALVFRVLPAGMTEGVRAAVVRRFGRTPAPAGQQG